MSREAERELAAVLEELERRARAELWCPHEPTERQAEFERLDCIEALYGGAAGGGKSDSLLRASLRDVDKPDYAAILFRRTYKDLALPGALMDRAAEWLRPTAARWRDTDKRWEFPSGATLNFGYLENENDKHRYASAEFQFVAFDELTQFTETQYRFLFSRLRRGATSGIPLRMRAATNPGGVGHKWVKRHFGLNDKGEQLERVAAVRPFVPAFLADNPHVDAESYRESLSRLDSATRAQLERGLWIQDATGLIYPLGPANLIEAPPEQDGLQYVLVVDLGASESKPTTAFGVLAWHPQVPRTVWVVECYKKAALTPRDIAAEALALEKRYQPCVARILDEGALGKGYGNEYRKHYRIPFQPADKANKLGFRKLLRGEIEHGNLLVVEGLCADLIEESGELIWNEAGTDNERGLDNHCTDAVLYGWRRCYAFASERPDPPLVPGTPEYLEAEDARAEELEVEELTGGGDTPFWQQ